MHDTNDDYKKSTSHNSLPGGIDRQTMIERIIRVDQAGEYGAQRIYAGQLATIKNKSARNKIEEMAEQEKKHLELFNNILIERKVRPTVFQPIWHFLGYALGASTALAGEKTAMTCTVAVEEAIDEHYAKQAEMLNDDDDELKGLILETREDEIEHIDIAKQSLTDNQKTLEPLKLLIKKGTKVAIWLSERY